MILPALRVSSPIPIPDLSIGHSDNGAADADEGLLATPGDAHQ